MPFWVDETQIQFNSFVYFECGAVEQPSLATYGVPSQTEQMRQRVWLPEIGSRAIFGYSVVENFDSLRCAELSALLESGGKDREAALDAIEGRVVELSFNELGCRVVQLAISVCGTHASNVLVQELRGHVCACIGSPSANYVIQKIVEVMPGSVVEFISEELVGIGSKTARHRFGCRILCRIFEHSASEATSEVHGVTQRLIDELLYIVGDLCVDHYGHHVVESAIEHGNVEQQHQIASVLRTDLLRYSKDRYGSHVVRKALLLCPRDDQQEMLGVLTNSVDNIAILAGHHFGAFVLRVLPRISRGSANEALRILQATLVSTSTSRQAKRVLRELQRHEV
eukprot:CAMPEP_0194542332 /NCGR_PEP_ID=MMETSP0253-20130528/83822_1 /TAXON_ID=2966 /ORGANISM="Noctiluca scintillans" /LENGTH=339 /DNA_ID=CAMNT_0039388947 /DNA_START=161 /DNA_END=1180 /DNA_ORIENTATION=-